MQNYDFCPLEFKELMYKLARQPRKYNGGFMTAENSRNKHNERNQTLKAISQKTYDEKGD